MSNATTKTECPPPGVYPSVPEAEYRAWDAANQSTLKADERSMAHTKYAIDHGIEETNSMRLGTAAHVALLEPKRFRECVAVMKKVNGRTNEGKEYRKQFEADNAGKTIIDDEQYAQARAMWRAVMMHPEARKLIEADGPTEVCAVWDDKETGLRCKARLDKYVPGVLALDIKTTRDASDEFFPREFTDRGYHRQLAWYRDGFKAASGSDTPFVFIVVENDGYAGVRVFRPDDFLYRLGWSENRRALLAYAECVKSGVWPGYPTGIQVLEPTEWMRKRYPEHEEWRQ